MAHMGDKAATSLAGLTRNGEVDGAGILHPLLAHRKQGEGHTDGMQRRFQHHQGGQVMLPAAIQAADGQQAPAQAPTGQAQQDTIFRLIVAAAVAAALASLLGLLVAGRLVRPLNRLGTAADGVARGDLTQRSGLAGRSDEFGRVGRTFDSMASDLQRAEETRRQFLQDTAH